MSLARQISIWNVISRPSTIDPADLLEAIRTEVIAPSHDARTLLLLRDSLNALRDAMGEERLKNKLGTRAAERLSEVLRDVPDDFGFPSIRERLMASTRLETVEQFLRELGSSISGSARIDIGGSVSLIFAGLLDRHTEDIDVVDEIPVEFRGEHDLLNALAQRYALRLAHFQSHYLPDGWGTRLIDRGHFGKLQVRTVAPLDIFVGKLFSARPKDRDDLRILKSEILKEEIVSHFLSAGERLRQQQDLLANAARNWYIVFGDELPKQ